MKCYIEKYLLDLVGLVTTEAAAEVIGARYLEQAEDERLRPVEVRYTDPAGERKAVTVEPK